MTTRIRTRLRTALNAHSYTHVHNWRAFGCCCTCILLVYDCFFLFFFLLHTHTYTHLIAASPLFKASRFTPRFSGGALHPFFLFCRSQVKRVEGFPLQALFSLLISASLVALAFYFWFLFFSVFFFFSAFHSLWSFPFRLPLKKLCIEKSKTKIVGSFLWAFVPRFRVHWPLTNSSLFNYNNFKCVFFFNFSSFFFLSTARTVLRCAKRRRTDTRTCVCLKERLTTEVKKKRS